MLFSKSRPTFEQVAREVLRLKQVRAERTKRNAEWQLERLIRNFGKLRVARITEDHWNDYVLRESARRKRTFYDDKKYMRQVLRFALRKRLVEFLVELPIPDLPSSAGREILPHELAALEKHAGPVLRFQIRIGWKMGLRLREMLRLRLDQIDLKSRCVRLLPGDTKARRERLVPIPSDLVREFEYYVRAARRQGSQHLFLSPKGGPVYENKTAWRRCRALAGVNARWHDLRHTAATVMLRRTGSPHVVKLILGMSDRTIRRYVHFEVDDLRPGAEVMTQKSKAWLKKYGKAIRELRAKYPLHLLRAAAAADSPARLAG